MTSRGHLILKLLRKPEEGVDGDRTVWEAKQLPKNYDDASSSSNQKPNEEVNTYASSKTESLIQIDLADEAGVDSQEKRSDYLEIATQNSTDEVKTYAELTTVVAGISNNIQIGDEIVVYPQEKQSNDLRNITQYSSESENSVENIFSNDSDEDPDYVFEESWEGESQNVSEHDEQTANGKSPGQDNVLYEALVNQDDVLEHKEDAVKEITARKGKKRKANKENWKKNVTKRQRNLGQAYTSSSKSKHIVEKKSVKPPCGEKCRLRCSTKYSEVERQQIFDEYWAAGDVEKHRSFILSCMQTVVPRYRYQREGSHRKENQAYYFQRNDRKCKVCKLFFMNTLDINSRTIRTVVDKKSTITGATVFPDQRGKHKSHIKVPEFIKDRIRTYIQSIPRIESHYCRSNTTREFIKGDKTLSQIHRDYVDECKVEFLPYANYQLFSRIFNEEFNISFFSPKKDQCELCARYKNLADEDKKQLEEKFECHILEKDLSRLEKDTDKKTKEKSTVVAVYDLQAVLPVPKGDISTFYYISKLSVFNLTVHDMKSGETDCFIWREGQGKRGANEIATCVLKYLENLRARFLESDCKPLDVIFYTDNCCGQQKNRYIIALYLFAVSHFDFINSITHKYLITGHSQNEGDSAHSVIEKQVKVALKSGPIFVPEQYVALIRTAKKKGTPYRVHELNYQSFYDFKDLLSHLGPNFKVDDEETSIKFNEIKMIKVEKADPLAFYYKVSYSDKDFSRVNLNKLEPKKQETTYKKTRQSTRKSKTAVSTTSTVDVNKLKLKRLYKEKLTISELKKKKLMNLVKNNIIPPFYSAFYDNL